MGLGAAILFLPLLPPAAARGACPKLQSRRHHSPNLLVPIVHFQRLLLLFDCWHVHLFPHRSPKQPLLKSHPISITPVFLQHRSWKVLTLSQIHQFELDSPHSSLIELLPHRLSLCSLLFTLQEDLRPLFHREPSEPSTWHQGSQGVLLPETSATSRHSRPNQSLYSFQAILQHQERRKDERGTL